MLEIVENLRAVGTPLQTLLVTALPRPSSCPLPRNLISAFSRSVVPPIISSLHHYECVAPLVANSLQSGRFWARSTASVHDSPWESRSFCTVLMQVIRSRPSGLPIHRRRGIDLITRPPNKRSWARPCCICTRVSGLCVCVSVCGSVAGSVSNRSECCALSVLRCSAVHCAWSRHLFMSAQTTRLTVPHTAVVC